MRYLRTRLSHKPSAYDYRNAQAHNGLSMDPRAGYSIAQAEFVFDKVGLWNFASRFVCAEFDLHQHPGAPGL